MWLRFYYRQSKVVYSLSFCRFTLSKVFSSENTVSIDVKFHMMGERVVLQIQVIWPRYVFCFLLPVNSLFQLSEDYAMFWRIQEGTNIGE